MAERHTQFGRALANANISGKRASGIYILIPGWSKEPFVKIGLTKNIYTRTLHGYSHYMPHDHPGNSFDLVGYLVVNDTLLRPRERRALEYTENLNGWEAPDFDREWRHWRGRPEDFYTAIKQLLISTRTAVDGHWYTFERVSGRILHRGGLNSAMDQASIIPLAPNATTRTGYKEGVNQKGKVAVDSDGMVVALDGTRRFRNSEAAKQFYQLPYTGRNL